MVRDLIENLESGPEIILETGGKRIDPEKEIGLENKGFPQGEVTDLGARGPVTPGMSILSTKIKEVTEVIGRNIIAESGKMVRDLTENIESGPEVILETGGKQIDPEKEIGLKNKWFPQNVMMDQVLFLFIMGKIFNRDH